MDVIEKQAGKGFAAKQGSRARRQLTRRKQLVPNGVLEKELTKR